MLNIDQLLPLLKRSMPKASEAQIREAAEKAEKAYPNLTDEQFLAVLQKISSPQQPQAPFNGLLSQLGAK